MGDSKEKDIEPARKIGMEAIHVPVQEQVYSLNNAVKMLEVRMGAVRTDEIPARFLGKSATDPSTEELKETIRQMSAMVDRLLEIDGRANVMSPEMIGQLYDFLGERAFSQFPSPSMISRDPEVWSEMRAFDDKVKLLKLNENGRYRSLAGWLCDLMFAGHNTIWKAISSLGREQGIAHFMKVQEVFARIRKGDLVRDADLYPSRIDSTLKELRDRGTSAGEDVAKVIRYFEAANPVGVMHYEKLTEEAQRQVLAGLSEQTQLWVKRQIFLYKLPPSPGDVNKYLKDRANYNELSMLQEKILAIGDKLGIIAHGVEIEKGGLLNLVNIICDESIKSLNCGPLVAGDPSWAAGMHGPYYVIVNFSKNWQDAANHLTYLVPEDADKKYLEHVLSLAIKEGFTDYGTAAKAIVKIETYREFVDEKEPQMAKLKTHPGNPAQLLREMYAASAFSDNPKTGNELTALAMADLKRSGVYSARTIRRERHALEVAGIVLGDKNGYFLNETLKGVFIEKFIKENESLTRPSPPPKELTEVRAKLASLGYTLGHAKEIKDTANPKNIMIGDTLILEGRRFLVIDSGTHFKADRLNGRFDQDDQYTQEHVKEVIEIKDGACRGEKYWLKFIAPNEAETKGSERESEILRKVNEHKDEAWTDHFAKGVTLKDASGNIVNVIDNIEGVTLRDFVNSTKTEGLDLKTYFQKNFINLATGLLSMAKALKKFEECTGKQHGDISNWHVIMSGKEEKFVLIDYHGGNNVWDTVGLRGLLKFIATRESDDERFAIDPVKTAFMPPKMVEMLKRCYFSNPNRYISNIDEFIADLESVLSGMIRERKSSMANASNILTGNLASFEEMIGSIYLENLKGRKPFGIDLETYPEKYGAFAIYYLIRDLYQNIPNDGYGYFKNMVLHASARLSVPKINSLMGKDRYAVQYLGQDMFFVVVEKLLAAARNGTFDKYRNTSGILTMAKELISEGYEPNLDYLKETLSGKTRDFKDLAKVLLKDEGLTGDYSLKWPRMPIRFDVLKQAADLIVKNPKNYEGISGLLKLAKDLGGAHLGNLYATFAHAEQTRIIVKELRGVSLEGISPFNWPYINMPYDTLCKSARLIANDPARYHGVDGHVRLAKELGKINLRELYTAFGDITTAKVIINELTGMETEGMPAFEWRSIDMPYDMLARAASMIIASPKKYRNTPGYLNLAFDLDKKKPLFSELYNAFGDVEKARVVIHELTGNDTSGFEDLNWVKIDLPLETLKKASELLLKNPQKYHDTVGYIRLAKDLGGVHLGHLHTAFNDTKRAQIIIARLTGKSAGSVKDLGWTKINLSYESLAKAAALIIKRPKRYAGLIGQIRISKALGGLSLAELFTAFCNIDREKDIISELTGRDASGVKKLGWSYISVPNEVLKKIAEFIAANLESYKSGNLSMKDVLGTVAPSYGLHDLSGCFDSKRSDLDELLMTLLEDESGGKPNCQLSTVHSLQKMPEGGSLAAGLNEADAIHTENLNNTPTIAEKTIICHIVAESILPEGQRVMLKTKLEKEMRGKNYYEKIVSLPAGLSGTTEEFMRELARIKAREEAEYRGYKVEFDVACPTKELVG
ncbi:MAG: hypothetical protein HQL28_04355, partial [Candidatus Omnitrophica bacterium]|nr:hypothetical protein [Candidatus Omnitrophota bacterium]